MLASTENNAKEEDNEGENNLIADALPTQPAEESDPDLPEEVPPAEDDVASELDRILGEIEFESEDEAATDGPNQP